MRAGAARGANEHDGVPAPRATAMIPPLLRRAAESTSDAAVPQQTVNHTCSHSSTDTSHVAAAYVALKCLNTCPLDSALFSRDRPSAAPTPERNDIGGGGGERSGDNDAYKRVHRTINTRQ
jgi:hypothetical protein